MLIPPDERHWARMQRKTPVVQFTDADAQHEYLRNALRAVIATAEEALNKALDLGLVGAVAGLYLVMEDLNRRLQAVPQRREPTFDVVPGGKPADREHHG